MNRNSTSLISQYLNFAADVNNNIAASIQLLNHLRLSVTDVVNNHNALASLTINSMCSGASLFANSITSF